MEKEDFFHLLVSKNAEFSYNATVVSWKIHISQTYFSVVYLNMLVLVYSYIVFFITTKLSNDFVIYEKKKLLNPPSSFLDISNILTFPKYQYSAFKCSINVAFLRVDESLYTFRYSCSLKHGLFYEFNNF